MIRGLRMSLALILIPIVTIIAAPVQWVIKSLGLKVSRKLPRWWHKTILLIMGVRVNIHGKISDAHPVLMVCNHVSWVDILVMGSIRPLCFIAKSEIGSWPLINRLAKLQNTLFVDRSNSRDAGNQADTIASRLLAGDVMVLFAEGTTSDGNRILAFKSSLLGAAQYAIRHSSVEQVEVQPVAISYTRLHGLPLGRRYQSLASWPGNVGLASHLFRFVGHSAFDIDVTFGDPLIFTSTTNRKTLTRAANQQVATMFGNALRHRL